jgi:hypothetical protein
MRWTVCGHRHNWTSGKTLVRSGKFLVVLASTVHVDLFLFLPTLLRVLKSGRDERRGRWSLSLYWGVTRTGTYSLTGPFLQTYTSTLTNPSPHSGRVQSIEVNYRWPSPAQSFFVSSPARQMSMLYGSWDTPFSNIKSPTFLIDTRPPHGKHRVQQLFYPCVCSLPQKRTYGAVT